MKPLLSWTLVLGTVSILSSSLTRTRAQDEDAVARSIAALKATVLPESTVARPQVLLLGTFHFDDQGLDHYKPQHTYDFASERGQAALDDVLDQLERFQPTRVCVEYPAHRQADLDREYQRALAGETGRPDEIHLLAFELALRLSHERVLAIDATPVRGLPQVDLAKSARTLHQESLLLADPTFTRYGSAVTMLDALKETRTLREIFLIQNDPGVLRLSHGAYLVGRFRVGGGEDYAGADAFPTAWYNRNLRIFSNILRASGPARERLVVLIGVGHVPILRHLAESSPEIELVDVDAVL